jgi:hypothetical protein
MAEQDAKLFAGALEEMGGVAREACPTCGRGGVNLAMPTEEDLKHLLEVKEGFDKLRRNFSPEMRRRMESVDMIAGYLHALIAGTISNEVR